MEKRKIYSEITLLHIIGAVMILLCHFSQKLGISALGELFISGVPLFLFVSGYLVGTRSVEHFGKWFKKRLIRLLLPFYLWIIPCMLILWVSDHSAVTPLQTGFLLTNLQGLNYIYWKSNLYGAVSGLGQLWYVTEIMVCTFLTPLFLKMISGGEKRSGKYWILIMAAVILLLQPLLMVCGFNVSYIITYFLGILVAKRRVCFGHRTFCATSVALVFITAIRFVAMRFIDGTDYYDRYLALVSSASVGIWVFVFVFWFREQLPTLVDRVGTWKPVAWVAGITYEIYIVHFWFLHGKWQVQNYIPNPILADVVVVGFSVLFAALLAFVSKKIKGWLKHV